MLFNFYFLLFSSFITQDGGLPEVTVQPIKVLDRFSGNDRSNIIYGRLTKNPQTYSSFKPPPSQQQELKADAGHLQTVVAEVYQNVGVNSESSEANKIVANSISTKAGTAIVKDNHKYMNT